MTYKFLLSDGSIIDCVGKFFQKIYGGKNFGAKGAQTLAVLPEPLLYNNRRTRIKN